jgi:hypothetical protein
MPAGARAFHSNDARGVFGTVAAEGIQASGVATPLLASTTGFELGMRSNLIPRLQFQLAVFQQDFGSELSYNADTGQDEAGAPSRRQGIEVGAVPSLQMAGVERGSCLFKPRYHTDDLAAYGLEQPYIADAPNFIYSAGVLINGLGPISGALQWRRLGTHSLNDGTKYPQDGGYSEWNMDVSYATPWLEADGGRLQPVQQQGCGGGLLLHQPSAGRTGGGHHRLPDPSARTALCPLHAGKDLLNDRGKVSVRLANTLIEAVSSDFDRPVIAREHRCPHYRGGDVLRLVCGHFQVSRSTEQHG